MFTDNESAFYGLKSRARAIAASCAETDFHEFIVGTLGKKEDNGLHVLRFDEDSNQIKRHAVYRHPDEVWEIRPSPVDSNMIFTVSPQSNGASNRARLWKMGAGRDDKPSSAEGHVCSLDELCDLQGHSGAVNVLWNRNKPGVVTTIDSNSIRLWDLGEGQKSIKEPAQSLQIEDDIRYSSQTCAPACWDLHHDSVLVYCQGVNVQQVDLRTQRFLNACHDTPWRSFPYYNACFTCCPQALSNTASCTPSPDSIHRL